MKKKGMVIEIKNKNAIIMTETGEFASVKLGNSIPICGENYEGYEVKDKSILKKVFITAVAAVFIFILSAVDYYNPVKAVELDMNSKIMLGLNRWNRVMTVSAQDKKGKLLLSKISIRNITLDKAVEKLMVEAKQEKTIKSFSEIKIKAVKGNVDLSLINSNIQKESITDSKKLKNSNNEVKNEDRSLKPNDSKSTDSRQNETLTPGNVKNENKPTNNGNNNSNRSNQIDNYKDKTNNANQSNGNSSKSEKIKENDNNSNKANEDRNLKNDQNSQGNKKK